MQAVIQKFCTRVDAGSPTADMQIIYRLAGGFPRLEEEYCLYGNGTTHLLREDFLHSVARRQATTTLTREEVAELFQLAQSALPGLLAQSPPHALIPDSLFGSLTVEVDAEKVVYPFAWQNVPGETWYKPVNEAMKLFRAISQSLQ